MSDILGKAVDFGKDAAAIGIRAGGMIVDKGIDLRSSLGGNAKFFEEADEKDTEIKKLLDGSNDRQKLEGMKKLIAVRRIIFSFPPLLISSSFSTRSFPPFLEGGD